MAWMVIVKLPNGKDERTVFPNDKRDIAENYAKSVNGKLVKTANLHEANHETLRYVKPRKPHMVGARVGLAPVR